MAKKKGYILSPKAKREFDEMRAVFTEGTRPRQEPRRRVRTGGSGGGGSLVYATSPNTTFDASFTYGASFDEPEGTGTALTDAAAFYLSTPWNTRITAPDKLFTFWNNIGDNYYLPVITFYVKITEVYPSSGGVLDFTCYYNDSATFSLGDDTAFPSGVEVKLNSFTNASASTEVRTYFNGETFIGSYDSENNIVYITHPRF
jgi:hypothetical protein